MTEWLLLFLGETHTLTHTHTQIEKSVCCAAEDRDYAEVSCFDKKLRREEDEEVVGETGGCVGERSSVPSHGIQAGLPSTSVCVCYVPATRSCSNVTKKRKTAVWVGFSTLVFSFFLLLVLLVMAVDILLADLLFVPVVDVASEKRRYKHELRPD